MIRNVFLFSVLSALGAQALPAPQASGGATGEIATPDYSKHNTCGPDGTKIYVGDVLEDVPAGTKCEGGFLVHASQAGSSAGSTGSAVNFAASDSPGASGTSSGPSSTGSTLPAESGTGTGTESSGGSDTINQQNGQGGSSVVGGGDRGSSSGTVQSPAASDSAGGSSVSTSASVPSASPSAGGGTNIDSTGKFDQTPACDGDARKSEEKRYVGYWYQAHDGKNKPTKEQLSGMTHIILAFATAEGSQWGYIDAAKTIASNFNKQVVSDIRGLAEPGAKLMAAFGGWGQDSEFYEAAASGSMETIADNMVKFIDGQGLDGIDLDWEYPVNNGAFYIVDGQKQEDKDYEADAYLDLMRLLRQKADAVGMKDMMISAAVPAIETDVLAFTEQTAPEMDKCLDFWNLMSYDYINRRSSKSGHHQGGEVIGKVIDTYEGRGVPKQKMNIGYGNYAKWWTLAEDSTCTPEQPLDCAIKYDEDPATGQGLGYSGFWLWNTPIIEVTDQSVIASAAKMTAVSDEHSFDDAQASAWVDGNYFWSWVSPKNIKDSCDQYLEDVGGVFFWGINADDGGTSGGTHIKAIAECARGAGVGAGAGAGTGTGGDTATASGSSPSSDAAASTTALASTVSADPSGSAVS